MRQSAIKCAPIVGVMIDTWNCTAWTFFNFNHSLVNEDATSSTYYLCTKPLTLCRVECTIDNILPTSIDDTHTHYTHTYTHTHKWHDLAPGGDVSSWGPAGQDDAAATAPRCCISLSSSSFIYLESRSCTMVPEPWIMIHDSWTVMKQFSLENVPKVPNHHGWIRASSDFIMEFHTWFPLSQLINYD